MFAQAKGSSTKLFVFVFIALGELVGMLASLLALNELITTSIGNVLYLDWLRLRIIRRTDAAKLTVAIAADIAMG